MCYENHQRGEGADMKKKFETRFTAMTWHLLVVIFFGIDSHADVVAMRDTQPKDDTGMIKDKDFVLLKVPSNQKI